MKGVACVTVEPTELTSFQQPQISSGRTWTMYTDTSVQLNGTNAHNSSTRIDTDEWLSAQTTVLLRKITLEHTHLFNSPLSGTTRVSRYQKGKTNLDFTEARDSEWQWHQLGRMQVCTSLQTDNHASCPSCCPTNSVKALKVCSLEESNE